MPVDDVVPAALAGAVPLSDIACLPPHTASRLTGDVTLEDGSWSGTRGPPRNDCLAPDPESVETAAKNLAEARLSGLPCPPVRGLFAEHDLVSAYAVQEMFVAEQINCDKRVVGAKIGLTSRAVQRSFKVYEPDFGTLFSDMSVGSGEEITKRRLIEPRVEAEVAFVLGRDIPYEQPTTADVVRATDYIVPAIEIVDSRVLSWDISIVDTVADNASSALYVLGTRPRRIDQVDLRLCGMAMTRGGELVAVGAGSASLGNPINAVAWLAGTMARAGRPLSTGSVVLSGALGPMVPVRSGDAFEAKISGLGAVSVVFAREE